MTNINPCTKLIRERHPDLDEDILRNMSRYTNRNHTGELFECFEKDENGVWQDVTQKELRKLEIEKLEEELIKMKNKEKQCQ